MISYFLSIPIAWLSLVLNWFIWFVQWWLSSGNTPECLTDSVFINLCPRSSNFKLHQFFSAWPENEEFGFTNFGGLFVCFEELRVFFRSWFHFVAISKGDALDSRMFGSSANWYALECFLYLLWSFMYIRQQNEPKANLWRSLAMIFLIWKSNFLY